MDTDPAQEIEELKQEVEELRDVTLDTNKQVHKMRRSARWALLFQIVWWVLVLAASGATYYYYIAPYVDQISRGYGNVKNFEMQIGSWFAQFGQQPQTNNLAPAQNQ